VNPQIRAVILKEFREFRRNRFVIGTMLVFPLVFLLIPIANVLSINESTAEPAARAVVGGALLMFFLTPLILPTTLAGYAVIGERDQGTLEPLLTTPLTREDLLLGKALAELIPTVVIAYSMYVAFLVLVRVVAAPQVVDLVWRPPLIAAEVLSVPLLAAFAIWVGIAFSTRSSDVRVAQQLSGLAVLPLLGLMALVSFRVIGSGLAVPVGVAAVLIVLDVAGWRVVSMMFDRERLLTRYGRR